MFDKVLNTHLRCLLEKLFFERRFFTCVATITSIIRQLLYFFISGRQFLMSRKKKWGIESTEITFRQKIVKIILKRVDLRSR